MSLLERPEPWENPDPERCHFEAVPEDVDRWKISDVGRCRFTVDRRACGAPSVAALRRGSRRPSWWHYCAEHLYGRWIEGGRVMTWRLVKNEE